MAADHQLKRRLSSATGLGYGLQEQYRVKRRDLRSPQYAYSLNSRVLLKWDDNGKRVVAKEDQVGISWQQLSSLVPSASRNNAKLADVVTIPNEVFELDDLSEVFSYEVWQSLLTEKERDYLTNFLPRGFEPDQVVQTLLGGDNFHFGNPAIEWGASLCSGGLHPDAIVEHEKFLKTNKKSYYSEIRHYHDNMIKNLQKLKEKCASSKDPEAEILQINYRSRRYAEKSNLPDANGFRSRKLEENVAVMSESPSSMADDKLYYSDNQKLSAFRDAEIQKRIRNEEGANCRHEKLVTPVSRVKVSPKLKKAEKLHKVNINSNDGAKYMSYVKISKKQHELVKSMKQSGSSIQSKSLNRFLGNLDSSDVKPYEMFVEEEQKRIHEYWSILANKDVPAALLNWRNRQSGRQKIMNSLWVEMEEKLRSLTKAEDQELVSSPDEEAVGPQDMDGEGHLRLQAQDEGLLSSHNEEAEDAQDMDAERSLHLQAQDEELHLSQDENAVDPPDMDGESTQGTSEQQQDDDSAGQGSISDDDKESVPSSMPQDSPMPRSPLNVNEGFEHSSIENQCSVQVAPLNVNEEFHLSSVENQSSMHNPPLNVNKEFNPMDLNAESDNVMLDESDFCSISGRRTVSPTSEACLSVSLPESHSSVGTVKAEEMPCSSANNVWSSIGLPESYCRAPYTHYASSRLSLRHPVVSNQPPRVIDLESDLPEEDATKDLLNRHTNNMPMFNPYPNKDRSEMLHSLIKRDNYCQDQKKTGLEFPSTTNVLLESSLFPGHLREQLQPSFAVDNRQKTENELYLNQNIQDSIFTNNRYPMQGHGHFPTLNVRDWSNTRTPTPIPPSQLSSGELLNHNWFVSQNRGHGGWSGSEGSVFPSPSLGGGSIGDQSLYSVLSQCNTLRSRAPYNSVASTEQIMPPTNYGQDVAGGIPMTSNTLPHTASPFDYLSGNGASATLKNNPNMGWMSLGHQNPQV